MKMKQISSTKYISENGWHLGREEHSYSPDGQAMGGRWVLRDEKNDFVDFDAYRHDLAERYGIDLD